MLLKCGENKKISSGSRTLRVSVQASSTTKLNASEVTNGVDTLKDEAIEFVGWQREVLSVMKYLSSGSEKLFNAAGTYGIDPSTYEKK